MLLRSMLTTPRYLLVCTHLVTSPGPSPTPDILPSAQGLGVGKGGSLLVGHACDKACESLLFSAPHYPDRALSLAHIRSVPTKTSPTVVLSSSVMHTSTLTRWAISSAVGMCPFRDKATVLAEFMDLPIEFSSCRRKGTAATVVVVIWP